MCGRFSVQGNIAPQVSDAFNISFSVESNANLSPSQQIATVTKSRSGFAQTNSIWGIKPDWSKKLLINAQAETVAIKSTFKHAFASQRCLIPCNGWFEWRNEDGKKVKYFFEHANKLPLYMAGILFKKEHSELVTLTTTPNPKCAEYHKRMPVLVYPENTDYWFNATTEQLTPLLLPVHEDIIQVSKASK